MAVPDPRRMTVGGSSPPSKEAPRHDGPVRKRSIIVGLRIFIILTLVGFVLVFYKTGSKETINSLSDFRISYFLLATALIAVDWLSGGARAFVFIRKITPISDRQAFITAVNANLANIFMAAATPFQTGGGAAQIYMLNRGGVSVSGAISVLILNFVATLGFLLVAGIMILRWLTTHLEGFHFRVILSLSSWIFYLVAAVFLTFLLRPMIIARAARWLFDLFGRTWKSKASAFDRAANKFSDFVQDYRDHVSYFWKNEKMALVHNVWLTAVLYFNKCLLAYIVLRGMGLDPGFIDVISVQVLLIFLIYFAPTPGASLLAETSAAALMSLLIAEHQVPIFSVLWRFFTTYFGVIVGGIILMRAIGTPRHVAVKESRLPEEPVRS